MQSIRKDLRDRHVVGVIADADLVTGLLLAGIGTSGPGTASANYFCVDTRTSAPAIETAFRDLTARRDIAVLLITQPVADRIRHLIDDYSLILPSLLEIPGKDAPYDPDRDSLLKRISRLCSTE